MVTSVNRNVSGPPNPALQEVFQEVRNTTPNQKTRFIRPNLWQSLAGAMSRPTQRKLLIGITLVTAGAGLLFYGAYLGVRGRFARQVRPEMMGEQTNQFAGWIMKTGVNKSEWRAISRLAKSGKAARSSAAKDAVVRSNALKLIRLRPDAATVKPMLDQCSTGQLCQLARLVVKERAVLPEGHEDAALPAKEWETAWKDARLPVSGHIFQRLREVQAQQESVVLDAHTLQALQAGRLDQVAEQVAFQPPAVASAQVDPTESAVKLRELAAELVSPLSLGETNNTERLLKACSAHAEALTLVVADPEQALQAGMPKSLVDALVGLVNDPRLAGGANALEGPVGDEALAHGAEPMSAEQLRTHLQQLSSADQKALEAQLSQAVNDAVAAFDFSPLTDRLTQVVAAGAPGPAKGFLVNVAKVYFKDQPLVDKKSMIASMWRGSSPGQTIDRQLVEMLKGAGPLMQKIMQMVAEGLDDEGTRKIYAEVKSKLRPIDPTTKKALLAQIVRDSGGKIESLSGVRTLGAASVGEAMLAKVKDAQGQEREVVIKLLRPGVAERAERERSIIALMAKDDPGMLQTFTGIANQIAAEMDLSSEAANVGKAQVYAGREEGIAVMQLATLANNHPHYMIVERAPGKNLEDVKQLLKRISNDAADAAAEAELRTLGENLVEVASELTVEQQRAQRALQIGIKLEQRMAQLSSLWVTEALLGSGFFHGDLHGGNMMYSVEKDQLTMIDLGNASAGTFEERQSVARMLFAIESGNPRLYLEALSQLLGTESKLTVDAMLLDPESMSRMRIVFAKAGELWSTPDTFSKLLQLLQSPAAGGIEIPPFVSNFGRSMSMLQEESQKLSDINKDLYLRSQPNFGATSSRFNQLQTEIQAVKAQIAQEEQQARQVAEVQAGPQLKQDLENAQNEEEKREIRKKVRAEVDKAVAASAGPAKARLGILENESSNLQQDILANQPKVDGMKLVERELGRRKWEGARLLGLNFLSRARFDSVQSSEVEIERAKKSDDDIFLPLILESLEDLNKAAGQQLES